MAPPPLVRELFDLQRDAVWALHCAEGPVPRAAVEAARAQLDKELHPWDLAAEDFRKPPALVKERSARLFGGEASDYTPTASTSHGLTIVAQTYPWRPGEEVLAPLGEFPSNAWPWKALATRGVLFREVPLWDGHCAGRAWRDSTPPPVAGLDPEARILEAIGPSTRLVTVSWVRFQDGLKLDLARLARGCAARGVDLVVDAIQGAGTMPMPLEGVAAFATGVHKGLLSPQGAGLLWTAPSFRARLGPLGSWLSVEGGGEWSRPATDFEREWLADGRRFEQGGMGGLMLLPLAESLRILHEANLAEIARHVDALQAALLARVGGAFRSEADRLDGLRRANRLGPILSFHRGGQGADSLAVKVQQGLKQKIYTSVREGYLRVALHGMHDESDVERLADWLSE